MKNDNSDTGKNSRTSKGSRLKIENFYRLVLAYFTFAACAACAAPCRAMTRSSLFTKSKQYLDA